MMKKKLVYTTLILLAILFQTSILPIFFKAGFAADNVLMLVLVLALMDGFLAFLGWAVFFGIIYDLAAYNTVGVHGLIFLGVTYLVSFFSKRFSMEFKGMGLLFVFLFIVFSTIFSRLVLERMLVFEMSSIQQSPVFLSDVRSIFLQIAWNVVFFVIWFLSVKKLKKKFDLNI